MSTHNNTQPPPAVLLDPEQKNPILITKGPDTVVRAVRAARISVSVGAGAAVPHQGAGAPARARGGGGGGEALRQPRPLKAAGARGVRGV